MKARVIFFHDDADTVILAQPRANGGTYYTLFPTVSQLVNHVRENGIEVTFDNIETR